jgi:hypothetical protein
MSPGRKLALTAEILAAYARVRWLLWRNGLPATLAALRRGITPTAGAQRRDAGYRLAGAVVRVCDRLPADSRCLTRSLILTDVLARRGIGSSLVIGVMSAPSFSAHAWVELDGQPLLPPLEWGQNRLVEL